MYHAAMQRSIHLRLVATVFALFTGAAPAAAQVNVTGTWQPKNWTLRISLRQEADRVTGYGGQKDFWFRGAWDGARLILIANNFEERRKDRCVPRGVFVLSGKTVSMLDGIWWQTDTGRTLKGPWVRQSPDGGEAAPYPYATELMYCGSLRTYELTFATGADTLQGSDWPILEAVSGVLKQNPSTRIEVAGHTDSMGDAAANLALSERRAATVKRVLVEKYGADAARIATKGWGPEQPLVDNTTPDNRALNR